MSREKADVSGISPEFYCKECEEICIVTALTVRIAGMWNALPGSPRRTMNSAPCVLRRQECLNRKKVKKWIAMKLLKLVSVSVPGIRNAICVNSRTAARIRNMAPVLRNGTVWPISCRLNNVFKPLVFIPGVSFVYFLQFISCRPAPICSPADSFFVYFV